MSDKTIEDLSDELWISARTLEKDIARLRGEDDPPSGMWQTLYSR